MSDQATACYDRAISRLALYRLRVVVVVVGGGGGGGGEPG